MNYPFKVKSVILRQVLNPYGSGFQTQTDNSASANVTVMGWSGCSNKQSNDSELQCLHLQGNQTMNGLLIVISAYIE